MANAVLSVADSSQSESPAESNTILEVLEKIEKDLQDIDPCNVVAMQAVREIIVGLKTLSWNSGGSNLIVLLTKLCNELMSAFYKAIDQNKAWMELLEKANGSCERYAQYFSGLHPSDIETMKLENEDLQKNTEVMTEDLQNLDTIIQDKQSSLDALSVQCESLKNHIKSLELENSNLKCLAPQAGSGIDSNNHEMQQMAAVVKRSWNDLLSSPSSSDEALMPVCLDMCDVPDDDISSVLVDGTQDVGVMGDSKETIYFPTAANRLNVGDVMCLRLRGAPHELARFKLMRLSVHAARKHPAVTHLCFNSDIKFKNNWGIGIMKYPGLLSDPFYLFNNASVLSAYANHDVPEIPIVSVGDLVRVMMMSTHPDGQHLLPERLFEQLVVGFMGGNGALFDVGAEACTDLQQFRNCQIPPARFVADVWIGICYPEVFYGVQQNEQQLAQHFLDLLQVLKTVAHNLRKRQMGQMPDQGPNDTVRSLSNSAKLGQHLHNLTNSLAPGQRFKGFELLYHALRFLVPGHGQQAVDNIPEGNKVVELEQNEEKGDKDSRALEQVANSQFSKVGNKNQKMEGTCVLVPIPKLDLAQIKDYQRMATEVTGREFPPKQQQQRVSPKGRRPILTIKKNKKKESKLEQTIQELRREVREIYRRTHTLNK